MEAGAAPACFLARLAGGGALGSLGLRVYLRFGLVGSVVASLAIEASPASSSASTLTLAGAALVFGLRGVRGFLVGGEAALGVSSLSAALLSVVGSSSASSVSGLAAAFSLPLVVDDPDVLLDEDDSSFFLMTQKEALADLAVLKLPISANLL